jgi:DNA (cytosine-5)-methyltransferase 1
MARKDKRMLTPQYIMDLNDEIIIDNFAGGGGASTGIELALGRHVDVAINHDPEAVSMHSINHPQTRHYCESVWDVNPREVEPGRKIGLLWLSPDCKHFSKAKGGKPVEKKIRGLAWVALRWAAIRKPRVIALENVEEFITWGPLVAGTDGTMRPCPKNKGREFNAFVNALRRQGYVVEWKELRASDYGTPTIRKRLFLIARRDDKPIVWPLPTHGNPKSDAVKAGRLKPWRTAAECIDWSLPCPSIFLTKEEGRAVGAIRPLAENTMRRVGKGVMRYVVNAAEPFIVPLTHHGADRRTGMEQPVPTITAAHRGELALVQPFITEHANGSNQRNMPADEPLRTQCAQVKGGHFALVSAFLTKFRTGATGSAMTEPMHTITAGPKENPAGCAHAMGVITAHIQRDMGCSIGHAAQSPLGTITAGGGGKSALVTSNLVKMRGTNIGQPDDEPLHTVSAQGTHFAEVRAFLVKYYGNEQDGIPLNESIHTVTARDRFGLVTVHGEEYAITDIGLRMLAPRELFRAQGFPESYIIGDKPEQGLKLTKSAQVRMCGNSVCPPLAAALIRANCADMIAIKEEKRRKA